MFWRSWNKADKTLLFAAVVFFLALALVIAYPKSLLARGFLACADAALVGGIADWFAVTALFKKPLGFPWHTALLPRRRESPPRVLHRSVGHARAEGVFFTPQDFPSLAAHRPRRSLA